MARQNQSAFVTRLARHISLTEAERDALLALEGPVETRTKRAPVFDDQRPNDRIAIVRAGWAVARVHSGDAQTTITQIFMAGDIVGLSDLGFNRAPHETTMQTDGSVNLLSRARLATFATDHPRLFAMLLSLSSLDVIALQDRMHAIARFTAEDRLMHFILSVKAKTDQTCELVSDRFPLPLSQREIGDVLGLTDIYVNRLLRSLQKSGDLTLSRPYIKMNTRSTWEQRLDFQDRYTGLDVAWAS